jgi:hypothetical protein
MQDSSDFEIVRSQDLVSPRVVIPSFLCGCSKPPDVRSVDAAVVQALHDSEFGKAQKLLDDVYGKGVLSRRPRIQTP